MKLKVENIAKISAAEIELNGITVIAGENNTGKSTVGRVLYSVFNGLYRINEAVLKERIAGIDKELQRIQGGAYDTLVKKSLHKKYFNRMDYKEFLKKIIDNILRDEECICNKKTLETKLLKFLKDNSGIIVNDFGTDIVFKRFVDNITQIILLDENRIKQTIVNRQFDEEFKSQINNINMPDSCGKITLTLDKEVFEIQFETDICVELLADSALNMQAIYIDNPLVLDSLNFFDVCEDLEEYNNHSDVLRYKLLADNKISVISEAINREKLSKVREVISSVASGDFTQSKDGFDSLDFIEKGASRPISLSNLSAGLKTFAIIKRLIENNSLTAGSVLILDEPEIHLHPEWQLVFAELLVLLQRQFDLTLLINTHSPYFLSAVEVYAKRHEVEEKCGYYLAELHDGRAVFDNVTNDTEKIYKKLALPFQKLEDLRYEA